MYNPAPSTILASGFCFRSHPIQGDGSAKKVPEDSRWSLHF